MSPFGLSVTAPPLPSRLDELLNVLQGSLHEVCKRARVHRLIGARKLDAHRKPGSVLVFSLEGSPCTKVAALSSSGSGLSRNKLRRKLTVVSLAG